MKKLKIYVYAICKNESKFVSRWVNSMKEADGIYVLDTGSTDDTVNKLKEQGVHVVTKEINPWRFDVARNESLNLVPHDADICVCTDLDEAFQNGWRKTLEELWNQNNLTQLRYLYHWSFDEYENPATTFYLEKIHNRHGYYWKHPVHEVIVPKDETVGVTMTTESICLNHYPDATKSRGSYLPLLEMSVEEDPNDDRNMHYLGREYMYYQKWDKCIETLHRHLNLSSATWKDERCASMRFIGRSYQAKGYMEEAKLWFQKSIEEAPYLREGYIELATLEYNFNHYESAYELLKKALQIKEKSNSYINEVFAWNYYLYDLLSITSFQLNYLEESYLYAKKAYELNPNDERLQENYELLKELV